ncbi:MAG: type II toxin-antitoxin system VapC family toxin [Kiritimatiellia bacterium]|nr:type II toxin-antitoxin system VapC family toxin [Kiritimatiellia bacterium]MDP6810925.1 type II toxin-antitoxin system VapC family toxin [Kiritimatiellia bacterium]MDP7023357.1 type II toxin-antitoxin system VapC family toxin [Kiritimatiellia bacterium]
MIVLDTHAWISFINSPCELGKRAAAAINKARENGEELHVSCISTWEIHMLAAKDRLVLGIAPDVWVTRCETLSFLRFHPVNNTIARMAVMDCAAMHPDPADRMIVATAMYLGATVVTRDSKIRDSALVKCSW